MAHIFNYCTCACISCV